MQQSNYRTEEIGENLIAVDVEGKTVSIGDGKNWAEVHSPDLKRFIKEKYGFQDWQLKI